MHEAKRLTVKQTVAVTLVAILFFCAGIYRAYARPAYVTAAALEQSETVSFDEEHRFLLTMAAPDEAPYAKWKRDDLEIPLPEGVTKNDVRVETHWTTGEIRVHFPVGAVASYLEEVIHADPEKVKSGVAVPDGAEGMVLCFETDSVYELTSNFEPGFKTGMGDTLVLHFTPLTELYRHVVVLDVMGGGTAVADAEAADAGEIALSVTEIVRERLESDLKDTGIKVYVTRAWDEAVAEEDRIALADAVGADFYLRVGVSEDAERTGLQAAYNEVFFLRGLNNARLADLTLRHVAVATGNRATAPFPAYEEDAVLTALQVPAMTLYLGSMESEEDLRDLTSDAFYKRAADGIYKAVLEAAALCD